MPRNVRSPNGSASALPATSATFEAAGLVIASARMPPAGSSPMTVVSSPSANGPENRPVPAPRSSTGPGPEGRWRAAATTQVRTEASGNVRPRS